MQVAVRMRLRMVVVVVVQVVWIHVLLTTRRRRAGLRTRAACKDAVRLLHVDMRPHVGGERGRHCVEGERFHSVEELWVAKDGKGLLERRHRLDHSARLGAAVWRAPAEHLVRTEQSVGLRLVRVDHPQHECHALLPLRVITRQAEGHRRPRERTLRVVDAVVVCVPRRDGAIRKLDVPGAAVVALPIHSFRLEETRRIHQQRGRRGGPERDDARVGAPARKQHVNRVESALNKCRPAPVHNEWVARSAREQRIARHPGRWFEPCGVHVLAHL